MQYKKKHISDKIKAAGLDEYLKKGFRGGNIAVIAQNAGVPIGNLYRYFDGKYGLLDAVLGLAYEQIPTDIDELYLRHCGGIKEQEDLEDITNRIIRIFDAFKKEIIILADKCQSSRYEDFCDKIISKVQGHLAKPINPTSSETDGLLSKLLAKALVYSLLDILRMDLDEEKTKDMTMKIIRFYFFARGDRE